MTALWYGIESTLMGRPLYLCYILLEPLVTSHVSLEPCIGINNSKLISIEYRCLVIVIATDFGNEATTF